LNLFKKSFYDILGFLFLGIGLFSSSFSLSRKFSPIFSILTIVIGLLFFKLSDSKSKINFKEVPKSNKLLLFGAITIGIILSIIILVIAYNSKNVTLFIPIWFA
jgi:RsiW-degrading membrane proteinase PrsW (M82 family)